MSALNGRGQQFELEPPEIPASVVLLVEYSQRSWVYLEDIRNAMQGFADHARTDFKVRVRDGSRRPLT